eukprot:5959798-Pyramimonas_sp.AAC.1
MFLCVVYAIGERSYLRSSRPKQQQPRGAQQKALTHLAKPWDECEKPVIGWEPTETEHILSQRRAFHKNNTSN